MKSQLTSILVLILLTKPDQAAPANGITNAYPGGFSIQAGMLTSVMRDDFISRDKYSDTYPFAEVKWRYLLTDGMVEIQVQHGNTETLSSGTISSWYETSVLQLNLLYRIKQGLGERDGLVLYLGPQLGFFSYFFSHTFASLTRYESEGSILSLGFAVKLAFPIRSRLQTDISLSSSLLSQVQKSFDYRRYPNSESNTKLSLPTASGSSDIELGIRTQLNKKISGRLGYGLSVSRIGEWENFVEASDIYSFELTYGL